MNQDIQGQDNCGVHLAVKENLKWEYLLQGGHLSIPKSKTKFLTVKLNQK